MVIGEIVQAAIKGERTNDRKDSLAQYSQALSELEVLAGKPNVTAKQRHVLDKYMNMAGAAVKRLEALRERGRLLRRLLRLLLHISTAPGGCCEAPGGGREAPRGR